jgi:deazaflavin-dependent oxidoreductase (nitroreductase family)
VPRSDHEPFVGVSSLDRVGDESFCYVTTLGRRTGRAHEIEIWFARAEDSIYMLSGGGDRADWVRNLRAHPAVTVRIGDETFVGTARVGVDGGEEARMRRLLAAKYQGWREGAPLSEWARTALPVAIDLQTR